MQEKKVVFVSHSEDGPAALLEELIRTTYPGEVEVFNSTRASSGLAAGEPIDGGILGRIRQSKVMIWLATPRSVENSFWMAWELGVASAADVTIIPCTCLGLSPHRLPLLQGGRNAPDLGDEDQLRALLVSLKGILGLQTEHAAEALNSNLASGSRSRLWGLNGDGVISLRRLGDRLLVANQSDDDIFIKVAAVQHDGSTQMPLSSLAGAHLEPHARRIPANSDVLREASCIYLEWERADGARFFALAPFEEE